MISLDRVAENIVGRLHGPMKFRLLLQPLTATVLAVRAGLRDARAGRVPYFWAVCTDAEHRRHLLREGWKDIARVFAVAVVIDGIYQLLELRWFYPGEAVIVAVLLALIPYLLIRGPVSRAARLFVLIAVLWLPAAPAAARQRKQPVDPGQAVLPAFAPKKGQSEAAMFDDELACRAQARKDTGFDPDAPLKESFPPGGGLGAQRLARADNQRRSMQRGKDAEAFKAAFSGCMKAKGYTPR